MADHNDRPGPDEYAEFYAGYIARVPDGGLVDVLEREADALSRMLADLSDERADHAYAPGKWTIREVVGHVTDAERVFAHRALRFARGDTTPLPGFEENDYVPAGEFGTRPLDDLLEDLAAVRRATIRLFTGLPADAWLLRGVASGQEMSVRAIACVIIGHDLHHRAILEERYGVRPSIDA